ncbi:MAG: hypothetical protein KKE31_06645 [Planctomycetes bacterium]|nr:hypothetical protein [Planctomycetota bacterium]
MAGNAECKREGHNKHICTLKAEGCEQKSPESFKQLTDNPKFRCGNCGAQVTRSENVCNPIAL